MGLGSVPHMVRHYTTVWEAPLAFWGGHKTGPNRKSLPVPTHSSASGMLRGVMGKRGIRHIIHEVRLLRLGGLFPLTSNEIKEFHPKKAFDSERQRTLRTTVILNDVKIAVKSSIWLCPNRKADLDIGKAEGMFLDRMRRRKVWAIFPTMGPKEFSVSDFHLVEDSSEDLTPINFSEDLGIQPFDQDFEEEGSPWYYAPLSVQNGVVTYPTWDEVKAFGLRRSA